MRWRGGWLILATLSDWNAYMNVLHELAQVEDDLRDATRSEGYARDMAERILFERFGVT